MLGVKLSCGFKAVRLRVQDLGQVATHIPRRTLASKPCWVLIKQLTLSVLPVVVTVHSTLNPKTDGVKEP